eukprot:COSAG02_NODE_456_length_21968_cov_13.528145_3_plen_95_part_00
MLLPFVSINKYSICGHYNCLFIDTNAINIIIVCNLDSEPSLRMGSDWGPEAILYRLGHRRVNGSASIWRASLRHKTYRMGVGATGGLRIRYIER